RRLLRDLHGLERLLPGLHRLVTEIKAPRGIPGVHSDPAELFADTRFCVFGQRDVAPQHMKDRRLAPMQGIAEIQLDRPVLVQFWPGLDLDHGASFGIAVNAGSEAVGALTFDGSEDRDRAGNVIAAAIERDPAPVDETVDITI